jgi:flagellar hook-basal body complex protein FliE
MIDHLGPVGAAIGGAGGLGSPGAVGRATPTEGGFAEALAGAVNGAESKQSDADRALTGLATGQDADLHGTMIALEEANIALRALSSTRDKIVEAYREIWNMQV